MPGDTSSTSPNVAAPAGTKNAATAIATSENGAAEILRARAILTDLLLADEFGGLNLLGWVGQDLNTIALELDSLAGQQKLFELWIEKVD